MIRTNLNQVEVDIERHVLTQSKKLSDNSMEKIFTRNHRNESGMFTYNCHLCSVASLPGERSLQTHITGRKHQQRLSYDYVPNAEQFRTPLVPNIRPIAAVFPGEPAPPGYEDEVSVVSFLESSGNKQDKPLIGMEYVVELTDDKAKEPFYVCTLCDKRCDPRNIIAQITSHRHRMKFLENHFPSTMDVLNRNQKFNIDMTYRQDVLSSIAEKIESKFGRLKPLIHEYRDYEQRKSEIHTEIRNKKHFSERDWPESAKVLLDKIKSSTVQEFESVSSESENEFNDKRRPLSMASIRFQNRRSRSKSPSRKVSSALSRLQSSMKQDVEKRKILTPRELCEQSNARMQEKYVIEKYKASVEISTKELEKKFKEFEKSPEKHPKYCEEWKAFWSRRYKELIAQGKDANGHDYKPEWIEYWTKRVKELHKKEIEKVKIDYRKKLNLTADDVKNVIFSPILSRERKSRTRSPRSARSRSPRSNRPPKRNESPINISDDSDDDRPRRSNKRSRFNDRRSEDRSRSRFEDSPYSRHSDYRMKETYDSTYYANRERNMKSKSPEIIDDGPVNLVSVCRLLSALESELGLLAKAIIDLLTKAVQLEKLKPNSADELLTNSENCNLLETVKEKLKGILSANLISPNKTVAVKRAIQNIATLLHEVSTRRASSSSFFESREYESVADVVDPVAQAKLEIAKVITASLLEQGRSDVSAEELEALVESFIEAEGGQESEPEEVVDVKVESKAKAEMKPKLSTPSKKSESSSGLENLTDEDLQTLLRNFADLTSDEQSHLIAYLSKIEQTNPARVEKLRKYVNIGDNDDFDDKKSEADLDSNVREPSPKMSGKKSPEPIKHDLSDDEYDDDAMVKKLGANQSQHLEISKPKLFSNGGSSNALKDNLGLADSLMSSLMESSMTPTIENVWGPPGGVDLSSAFYQQQIPMNDYYPMNDARVNMSMNMSMQPPIDMQMPMMMQQQPNNWPHNNASNFFDMNMTPEFSNRNKQGKGQIAKRNDFPNSYTGRGRQRRF